MTELRLGQINTIDINTSEFASANSVNSVQANLTTLASEVGTISSNVNAFSDSAANDYATYTTLTSLINIVSDNADSKVSAAYANETELSANYSSNTLAFVVDTGEVYFATGGSWARIAESTEVDLVQDNLASLTSTVDSADANLYNTYTSLSSLIDTVQDNVGSSSGGNATIIATSDKFTTSTSNQFTLSRSVTNRNDIVVSLSGILQSPGLGYEVSNTTLTLANTLPLQQGIPVEVRHLTGVSGAGSIWQEIITDALLASRGKVIVDTSSSEVILTLPQSPSLGDEVRIIDGAGNASNNTITLYGNGSNIEADTSNVVVDVDRSAFTMVYYNSYNGWLFGEK